MQRPRRPFTPSTPPSPIDAAMLNDQIGMADQLAQLLDATKDFDQGSVKGILYQKPVNGQGSYKWIDEVFPPWDLPAIFADLKDRFGGGDFELRVYADGKIRKNIVFPIARERERPAAAAPAAFGGMGDMFAMMLSQQNEARREATAAADRQMTIMLGQQKAQADLMSAILTRPQPQGTSVADTIALVASLQGGKGGGFKETIEAMAAMKALLGDGAPAGGADRQDFDPEDMMGSILRLAGPITRAVSNMIPQQRGEGPAASASGAPPPSGGDQLALAAGPSRYRVLDLVRVDVMYGYQRGHDAQKIAELVYDVIEANNVTEEEIDALVAAFALPPDGLDSLAAEGLDLRGNPGWAHELFAALLAIHTAEPEDDDADSGRDAGGAANA